MANITLDLLNRAAKPHGFRFSSAKDQLKKVYYTVKRETGSSDLIDSFPDLPAAYAWLRGFEYAK